MTQTQYLCLGIAVTTAVLLFAPLWREMHHQGLKGQSSLGFLIQNLAHKERAKHISIDEAALNAKARYMLGVLE